MANMENEEIIALINKKIEFLESEMDKKWDFNLNNGCMLSAREEIYAKKILLELRKEIEDV